MGKVETMSFEVPETVKVQDKTFFAGTAMVTETEKELIELELERLKAEREWSAAGSGEISALYTIASLTRKRADELMRIARDEMNLVMDEKASKAELIKAILENQ